MLRRNVLFTHCLSDLKARKASASWWSITMFTDIAFRLFVARASLSVAGNGRFVVPLAGSVRPFLQIFKGFYTFISGGPFRNVFCYWAPIDITFPNPDNE